MVPFRDRVNFFHLITNLFQHYRIKIRERKWYAKFLFNLDRKKKYYFFLSFAKVHLSGNICFLHSAEKACIPSLHERQLITNRRDRKEPVSWTMLLPSFPYSEENKTSPITVSIQLFDLD